MTLTMQDIKHVDSKHPELKRKLILEVEQMHPSIDSDLLDATITGFLLFDNSNGANQVLTSWILYVKAFPDAEGIPTKSLTASQLRNKSKVIMDYNKWLSSGSNFPPEIMKMMNEETIKIARQFVRTDNSTTLYELIKNWEVKTFNTYTADKKTRVIGFVKQYK